MEIVKGLRKTINHMDQPVFWLHYSADPDKDPSTESGKKWFEQAGKDLGGHTSLRWRAEMEMDFSAGSGDLIFPELQKRYFDIVIDPFDVPNTFLFYAGMDWGTISHPISFHVYAESPEKKFYSIWEFHKTRVPIKEFARVIREECPYYDRLQWIALDPRAYSLSQQGKNGLTTLGEMFHDPEMVGDYTIDKIIKAHSAEDRPMINRVRNLWAFDDPKLKIFSSCPVQIRELQNLIAPSVESETAPRETIVDKNNDSWDDLKYFLSSHPYAATVANKPEFGTIGYIDEVTKLAQMRSEKSGSDLQSEFNHLWGIDL